MLRERKPFGGCVHFLTATLGRELYNKEITMIEVQLSKTSQEKLIVTFDANVVRYFSVTNVRTSSSANGRIHVGHIKSIEITTNPKGKHALLITTKFNAKFSSDEVDDEALGKVKKLVAEVQRAMQSTAL